jgi:hypothetical protein
MTGIENAGMGVQSADSREGLGSWTAVEQLYCATQHKLRIWSYDWGETVRLEAETAGIRKEVGLILERQDCHRVSAKA